MHMKRVMMMRPKLVLKESMRVNQYIPPYEETDGTVSGHVVTERSDFAEGQPTLTSVTSRRPIR